MTDAGASEPSVDAVLAQAERRSLLVGELHAVLHDRRRLAERLHDGPHQLLLSVGMRLRLLEDEVPAAPREHLAEIARQVAAAREELRAVSLALGAAVAPAQLIDALAQLLHDSAVDAGWTTTFAEHGLAEVADRVYVTIVRVVQEALGALGDFDSVRHVGLDIGESDGSAVLAIEARPHVADGGRRLEATLLAIRDRAALVAGSAELVEDPGSGTTVRIRIPLDGQPSGAPSGGSSSTNTEPAGSPAR